MCKVQSTHATLPRCLPHAMFLDLIRPSLIYNGSSTSVHQCNGSLCVFHGDLGTRMSTFLMIAMAKAI